MVRERTILYGMSVALASVTALLSWPAGAIADPYLLGVNAQAQPRLLEQLRSQGLRPRSLAPGLAVQRLELPRSQRARRLAWLRSQPGVRYVEPDRRLRAQAVPNDPLWSSQWAMTDLGVASAWNAGTPAAVTVAVIDSGINPSHPDLSGRLWTNPGEVAGNGVDDDSNGKIDDVNGWDWVAASGTLSDPYGHGTHIAGIIGAAVGNGAGIAGLSSSVKLMPLRFMDETGAGSTSQAVLAINYAVAKGAKIINASWGGTGFSNSLNTAITAARNAGVLVLTGSGDGDPNTNIGYDLENTPFYPSSYPQDNILSVAAVSSTHQLAGFSNFGSTTVDLGAPGVGILSTLASGGYGTMSGTSMAAPYVAGAAAWLWGMRPASSYLDIRQALLNGATATSALAGKTVSGKRLSLLGAWNWINSQVTNTGAPSITRRGDVLQCNPGSWTGTGVRYSYVWQLNGAANGRTTATFPLGDSDWNTTATCVVTARNNSSSASASSSGLTITRPLPKPLIAPSVSGLVRSGATVSCTSGKWLYGPLSYSWRWTRDGADISGATTASYTFTSEDVKKVVRCVVTATNSTGTADNPSRPLTPRL